MSSQLQELRQDYGSYGAMAAHLQEIIFRYSHCRLQLSNEAVVEGTEVANDIYFLRDLKKALEHIPEQPPCQAHS